MDRNVGMNQMVKDKVVVVTGAGRGIGKEMALLMAEHGAKVLVNDIGGSERGDGADRVPAMEGVAEINDAGGQAAAHFGSVANFAAAKDIVGTAIA